MYSKAELWIHLFAKKLDDLPRSRYFLFLSSSRTQLRQNVFPEQNSSSPLAYSRLNSSRISSSCSGRYNPSCHPRTKAQSKQTSSAQICRTYDGGHREVCRRGQVVGPIFQSLCFCWVSWTFHTIIERWSAGWIVRVGWLGKESLILSPRGILIKL